jgi:predicted Zn finger-like uncharacterized protein
VKFLCEQCKAKYQIADEKAVGKTVRMKCRKCGHLIEVRAAVTETSVSSALPERERSSAPPEARSPPKAPPAPRARPLATEPPTRAAAKPERPPGALEGAFKSVVRHDASSIRHDATSKALQRRSPHVEDEAPTPFDMPDLSPSDEWYVAINGVPVGPVRVAEVRRKAALGAVTEDSLVWQEGLDEWRPLRLFPELATSVREAMTRLSRPPTTSAPPPPPSRAPGRSVAPSGHAPRIMPPPRSLPAPQGSSRSNVVPIMSRLATAERLDPAPLQRNTPDPGPPLAPAQSVTPSVVPDPFAGAPLAYGMAGAPSFVGAPGPVSMAPAPLKRSPPWMALAMVASAVAFGVTAAVLSHQSQLPPPAGIAPPAPSPPAALAAPAATAATMPAATSDLAGPATSAAPAIGRAPAPQRAALPAAGATASTTGRALDLHSLTQNTPNVTPTDDPGTDAPKPTGQALTEAQVRQVMALHQVAIGRVCWDRNPSSKPVVNVNVSLTVGPDGSAQNVVATGDEPSVAKCIENDVRGWHFPATGSAQKTVIPFKFVRQ